MEQKQSNRVTMFKTTIGILNDNQPVWSATAPFVTAVQDLNDVIAAIDQSAQTQEIPRTGVTVDKHSARESLEDVLFLTCEALGVIGHTANDNDLIAVVDLTPSGMQKLNDEELANRATTILERANAKKTDLATLNVTQANLDELTQTLQAFKASKERPREAVATRAAETQSLASLIRGASNILKNQIDRLVNLVGRSNSEFVSGYSNARVIVDRAATHTSAQAAGSAPTPTPNP